MNIFFIIILFFSINEVSSKKNTSVQEMKWLEAQNFCQKHGMVSKAGKLSLTEQDLGKYWTRYYTKRSDWIHFLGCFDQDTVLHNATSNLTILDKTFVKCQLLCLPDSDTFGIQGNSCFCLSTLDNHVQRLHINWCNLFDDKFPVGNNMNNSIFIYRNTEFNAIRSDKIDATKQKDLCVQMFCVKFNEVKFTMADCESIGNALCTNKVLLGNYTWPKAIQECVEQSTSVDYLEAGIDLGLNPPSSNVCTNYNISFTGPLWLGIQSSTLELEYNFKEDLTNLTMDMKCRSCRKDCKFEDCSESRLAFCEPASEGETISKDETTSQDNKGLMTNISTKITPLRSSSTQSTTNASSEITPVVYSVPVALAVFIVVVCFLYCRKKSQKKRNLDVVSTAESKQISTDFVTNTPLYEMADNSKLSIFHSYDVALNTVNIPKSDGDITGEKSGVYKKANGINVPESTDVYNRLWEKDITTEQKENIYDCSSTVCDKENPLYDVTTKKADHNVSPGPTYDHAVYLDNQTGKEKK